MVAKQVCPDKMVVEVSNTEHKGRVRETVKLEARHGEKRMDKLNDLKHM